MNSQHSDSEDMEEDPSLAHPIVMQSQHGHQTYFTSSPDADFQIQQEQEVDDMLGQMMNNQMTRNFMQALNQQLAGEEEKTERHRQKARDRENKLLEMASRDKDSKLNDILEKMEELKNLDLEYVTQMSEHEAVAPQFDYPGSKYFNRHLALYVQRNYTNLYLDIGLLDIEVDDMSEINSYMQGEIIDLTEETQIKILEHLKEKKRRFGLAEILSLNQDKSKKPIGNIINIIKYFEISVYQHCFKGLNVTSLPDTEDVLLASQIYSSFYSESLVKQEFQIGGMSPIMERFMTKYEYDDGPYSSQYVVYTFKIPSQLRTMPEVIWRNREVLESTRQRIQNFVPTFARDNPDEEKPCGQYLADYILTNDVGAYQYQRQVMKSVISRIDDFLEKNPVRDIPRKAVYVGNSEMRQKDLCVTEAFARKFFGSDEQLINDADGYGVHKNDEDGNYYIFSSERKGKVQISFNRMEGIEEKVVRQSGTNSIKQQYLHENTKTIFTRKGTLQTLKNRCVRQDGQVHSEELNFTVIRYESCSKGPPIFDNLNMSASFETEQVAVYQAVVQGMFIGNIYLLKESPDHVIKRDDCRHLFATCTLKTRDGETHEFVAGKLTQEMERQNPQLEFTEIRGVLQHRTATFIETHDGEVFCDDQIRGEKTLARGTMSWKQPIQMANFRDTPLGVLEEVDLKPLEISKLLSVFEEHDLRSGEFISMATVHTQAGKLIKWEFPEDFHDLSFEYETEDKKLSNVKFKVVIKELGKTVYKSPEIESSDQYFGLFHNIIQMMLVDFAKTSKNIEVIDAGHESANMYATFLAPRDGWVKVKFKNDEEARRFRHVTSNKDRLLQLKRLEADEDMIIVEVKTSANKNVAIANYEKKSAYKQERVTPVIGSFQGLVTNVELAPIFGEGNLRMLSWLCYKMYESRIETMAVATSMLITKQFSLKNSLGPGKKMKK